ncbi:MAG: hypothetical protein PHS19_00645, partial [Eubacteriales bacterium]|nr:hypothetical protein [Eubacteriales bacterium]
KTFTKTRIILAILVFLLCAGVVFVYLSKVFSMGDSDANRQTFKAFYAEKENTIDVIYLGTSASNRYFINPKAFHDEGISSFTLATMGMPLFYVPNLIDEVEKSQDPDLYIIELRWVDKEVEQITDAHIRRVTDNLKMSENRHGAIKKSFEYMGGSKGALGDITYKEVEYLFPIIKYHSRLAQESMTVGDLKIPSSRNETKGYVMSYNTTKQVNQFMSRLSDKREPLSEMAETALDEVLDYCDTLPEDKQVLFVLSPYSVKKAQMPKFNTAIDIVKERGYDVINFNTPEMYQELDIDWDHDFYNSKHLNFIGAEKYTNWLTAYIKQNYNLKDHRGDAVYDSWEKAYKIYRDYVKDGILTVGHKDKIGGEVTILNQNNPDADKIIDQYEKKEEYKEQIKEKNGIEDTDDSE